MAYWEFLLQKEGDRDWLPLETAHVEISEGRYRIIAHTSYSDTAVDIRLSHRLANSMPPRRKTLKRIGQTNENGLMVVIPFTHLAPGNWTVTCSAANESVTTQAAWQYGVQLEVLAIESGMEYWDTDLDEAAIAEDIAATQRAATDSASVSFPDPPPTSPSEPSTASTESRTNAAPPVSSLPPLTDRLDAAQPLEDLPLRLQLQHQALVANARSAMTLPGQVMSFSAVEGLPGEGTLWLQLRNPETGAIAHQASQALSIAQLPKRFDLPVTLPAAVETRLLVGELSLWTATEPPQILAIQGFTVTLNLDALLEVVANQAERSPADPFEDLTATAGEDSTVSSSTAADDEPPTQPLSTLSPREIPFRLIYLPSAGLTLPPVIYRPIDKKTVGAPSLPSFGKSMVGDRPSTVEAASPPAQPTKPLDLPPLDSPRPATDPVSPTDPAPRSSVELPTVGRPLRPSPSPKTDAAATPAAEASSERDRNALTFQPDFQGRFWHRLSALAEEAQKAAADQKAQLESAGVTADADTADPAIDLPFDAAGENPETQNYEVVIYDTEEPAGSEDIADDVADSVTEPLVEVLQPEDPEAEELGSIPVPDLVLPQGELVAGRPLPISVRLPLYPRRLAVKVWVTDIQSRTLIDRPRWLMTWTPGDDEQTALLQLQVPLGSIEARFEAIAIDLATQQESYKTSHIRAIVPPSQSGGDIEPVL